MITETNRAMEYQPLPMHLRVEVLVPDTNLDESLEPTLHALRVHGWSYRLIKDWLPGAQSARKMLLQGPRRGHEDLERTTRLHLTDGINRLTLKVTNDFTLMIQRDAPRL